ncbi:MAG TPA: arylamine N-acetyltransferase [Anaerolineales bacterium]|nr:arylamine N-acetyltransferase [Anaerolineales bacterium]
MDIYAYLERIQYSEPIKPDVQTLYGLQRAHLLHIPFENLDIVLKRPILLDRNALWEKIILHQRGGFCYELNGLFGWLLEEIGFVVTYLDARVFNQEGKPGIEFDHLALLVQVPHRSRKWLADVGFGDSFSEPLSFEGPQVQIQGLRSYRLEQTPDGYVTWQRNYDGSWERQYFFDIKPHNFPEEYLSGCTYHQTSPLSSFTRGSIISRATPSGRVSLKDGWLILTEDGQRTKHPIQSRDEYQALLKKYFDVTL